MEKSKLQNNRQADRFKSATMKLLNIVATVSQTQNVLNIVNDFTPVSASTCALQNKVLAVESNPEKLKNTCGNITDVMAFEKDFTDKFKGSDINSDTFSGINFSYWKDNSNTFQKKFYDEINALYHLHCEREKELEVNCKEILMHLQSQYNELASVDIISKRIAMLKNITTHLQKIIAEVSLLKQKLRTPVFQDVWDVHIHYHKFIIHFFETSRQLMLKLEKNTDSYQVVIHQNLEVTQNLDPYINKLSSIIMQFEKYLGSLSEFRKCFREFNEPKELSSFSLNV